MDAPFWQPRPQSCSRDLQQCRMASKPLGVLPRGVFRLRSGILSVGSFLVHFGGWILPHATKKWPKMAQNDQKKLPKFKLENLFFEFLNLSLPTYRSGMCPVLSIHMLPTPGNSKKTTISHRHPKSYVSTQTAG